MAAFRGERLSASATAFTTATEGLRSRPCSRRVRYSTLIPARPARSERLSPGALRRPWSGSPSDRGWMLSRLARMKSPNGVPMLRG